MRKLDMAEVAESLRNGSGRTFDVGALQVATYVMCGGGMLGRMAAEQPADFYIDGRAGRLPYSRRAILQAVAILKMCAELHGMNPHQMPPMPCLHGCGVW